jgi:hypothetical protein
VGGEGERREGEGRRRREGGWRRNLRREGGGWKRQEKEREGEKGERSRDFFFNMELESRGERHKEGDFQRGGDYDLIS